MALVPDEILIGRKPLEQMPGVTVLADATWEPEAKCWFLELEVETGGGSQEPIPGSSRWCISLAHEYPLGAIDVVPSLEGGIAETFPHQLNNSLVGALKRPWRPGKLCLHTGTASLDRHEADRNEPRSAERRLAWHVERTKKWLAVAARGELVLPGDPFELPDYRQSPARVVLFRENERSLGDWQEAGTRSGTVSLARVNDRVVATRAFSDASGAVVFAPEWGPRVEKAQEAPKGLWLLAPQPLVRPPWQAPMTWGELRGALAEVGIDPLDVLERHARELRDGKLHPLLIGSPIPRTVGEAPVRVHWTALELPPLARADRAPRGFRNSAKGLWSHDVARRFRSDAPLCWCISENADDSELTSRGSLNDFWTEARVLVIGAGALGGAVSEMLVRGGVRHLALCDAEPLEAGNLVRHLLLSSDVGESKVGGLARRLVDASPNAKVEAIEESFPPTSREARELLANSTVVVDCSANDDVLFHLEAFPFDAAPTVFHLSFGREAARLFLYGNAPGPVSPTRYFEWIEPWLEEEREERAEELRPAAGCWHPAFPARSDAVWLLAATAVSWMNATREAEFSTADVFRRLEGGRLERADPA